MTDRMVRAMTMSQGGGGPRSWLSAVQTPNNYEPGMGVLAHG